MTPARPTTTVFRTDAALHIGTGHVMRCLTLADELRRQGGICHFIARAHAGHLGDLITARGHALHLLGAAPATDATAGLQAGTAPYGHWLGLPWQQDAGECAVILAALRPDWLVVDHYALDAGWERAMRRYAGRLMVIDDLADRPHDCDLLLDQNLGRSPADYAGLVPAQAALLIGPRHTLLRPEFAEWRAASLARRQSPELRRLLITMGGVDKDNATGAVLDVLRRCALPNDLQITAVLGPHAPALDQVRLTAGSMPRPTEILVGVSDMAALMARSDLAIGSGGGATWERLFMALPTLVMSIADNQTSYLQFLAAHGYVGYLADVSEIGPRLAELDFKSFQRLEEIDIGTLAISSLMLSRQEIPGAAGA